MKTEQQYFEEAIPFNQYMDSMTDLKDQSFAIYNGFEVPVGDEFIALLKEKKPHILAITEHWCGDAMINNPVIRRVAEAGDLDIRAVFRDADTDLIDRYLTNGGRSIPKYLLLNDAGKVLGTWGPRATQIQEYVMNLRANLPDKEDPSFEDAQKELFTNMRKSYVEDQQLRQYVYEDFKTKVSEMLNSFSGAK